MLRMKINKELLTIKGHYFLRYAGMAPLVMLLPVIVRSKGLSAQTVGLLWSVLPVVGLITNSISGTLADYFKAHRIVLLSSVVCLTTGVTSMYWIPELPFAAQASGETQSLDSLGNATLGFTVFLIMGNSSSMGEGLAGADPEMMVAEGQAPPLDLPNIEEVAAESGRQEPLVRYPQFWLIFFALMAEQIGISVCVMMSDAVCFQILGSERHKYGQQRLWGTIGMGLMAVVSGALIDVYSQGFPQKDYLPAVICGLVLMVADILVVARIRIPYADDHKLVMGDVGSTLLQPLVLLFLVTVYVMGASLGIVWVFKLMMVEDVALAWNAEFPALKLLQGLVLLIETIIGEVPFFFLSGRIIQRLGYTPVLITSLVSTGLRCCLYYTVTNPWWFLPIELLNGPSYSLFHTVMASYASHIAPPGAQATLQSVVRATFSTGLSTAGFLGGILYNTVGGSAAFLHVGTFDLAYVLVFGLLHVLITRYCTQDKTAGEPSCLMVPCQDKVDPFAGKSAEVVKELLLEQDCGGLTGAVARPNVVTDDECVKFMV